MWVSTQVWWLGCSAKSSLSPKRGKCGSAGQSIIQSACITAFWLVVEVTYLNDSINSKNCEYNYF